jgi:hypothetical protein
MAVPAQALQFAEKKFVAITFVRFHMVGDRCLDHKPTRPAHATQARTAAI